MGLKIRRALEVGRVARRGKLLRMLGEVGAVGDRPATREGAVTFRAGLEELGTTSAARRHSRYSAKPS